MKPYTQTIKDLKIIRTFDTNIKSDELLWHRDEKSRVVKILEGKGWKFQRENELPTLLKKGDEIFIPLNTYHRIFKGTTTLVIEITEQD
jgi:quercetin dioxygenase-like cupin family protein